jgi:copper resistance protein B
MDSRLAVLFLGVASLARAGEPVPPVTAAERAAAFPDVSGTDQHVHMQAQALGGAFEAEQLEWQWRDGDDALEWDVAGWVGGDVDRLWLRDEGEHVAGSRVANQLELLWGHAVAPWWDLVAGLRQDTGPGPARTYAALGVQGLAPQWFDVEATAYVGERGQAGVKLQADYQWLLTNRLFVTGRAELQAWSKDDEDNGIGGGLSQASVGLRLRYEIRRELAPYLGVEWSGLLGDTADLARDAGDDTRDMRLVAGLHFWY